MLHGVRDFSRWMSHNHGEWVLVAACATLDNVLRVPIESRAESSPEAFLASGRWLCDVPVRAGRERDRVTSLVAVVQLRSQPWTVAMYKMFNLSLEAYGSAQKDAHALSKRLDTLALEFSAEDTSFASGYHLFEKGELVEVAEWSPDVAYFGSVRRPTPPWSGHDDRCLDGLLQAIGLCIPPCYGRDDRDDSCVAVGGNLSVHSIERADLIDLRRHFRRYRSMTLDGLQDSFRDRLVILRRPSLYSGEPDEEDDPF
jgi:hypothetical protein